MEILGKILGGEARVKIMRLFLSNKGKSFSAAEIAKRSRVSSSVANKELRILGSAGFIKKKSSWYYNPSFKYGPEFENLLLSAGTVDKEDVLEHFKKVGRIKLFLISGVFIKSRDSRADLLIVGDKLNKKKIEAGIKKIEAEVGKELSYALFDTNEFIYRFNMYDKLVRDILDYPHEVVLESRELSTHSLMKS